MLLCHRALHSYRARQSRPERPNPLECLLSRRRVRHLPGVGWQRNHRTVVPGSRPDGPPFGSTYSSISTANIARSRASCRRWPGRRNVNTGSLMNASASAAATIGTSSAAAARTSIGINAVIIAGLSRARPRLRQTVWSARRLATQVGAGCRRGRRGGRAAITRRRRMSEGSWVGLDVHARSVVAGVIDQGSGELRSVRVAPGKEGTVGWLKTLPAPVRVVYEAVAVFRRSPSTARWRQRQPPFMRPSSSREQPTPPHSKHSQDGSIQSPSLAWGSVRR